MNTNIITCNASNSTAFRFGLEDAKQGKPCVPELIFIARAEQVKYATGYESVSGVTFATSQFTGSELAKPEPVAVKTHNWGDWNATVAIRRIEAHQDKVQRMYEATCAVLGEDCGDILFLAA